MLSSGGPFEVQFQSHEKARRLSPIHHPVVEGQRERQDSAHRRLAVTNHDMLADPARSDDRDLRWHDDQIGKAPADHSEIGKCDGCAPQFVGRDRARLGISAHAVEPGSQVLGTAFPDVAQNRYDQSALGVDGDADVHAC